MKIEKREYLYVEIPIDEARDWVAFLEQVDGTTSNLPDWVKNSSRLLVEKLKSVGL